VKRRDFLSCSRWRRIPSWFRTIDCSSRAITARIRTTAPSGGTSPAGSTARSASRSPSSARRPQEQSDNPSRFNPRQVLLAHAAIADPKRGRLIHEERAARAGFSARARRDRAHRRLDRRLAAGSRGGQVPFADRGARVRPGLDVFSLPLGPCCRARRASAERVTVPGSQLLLQPGPTCTSSAASTAGRSTEPPGSTTNGRAPTRPEACRWDWDRDQPVQTGSSRRRRRSTIRGRARRLRRPACR